MPSNPFPVSGKVYDSDGVTALANVRVVVQDIRTGETQTATTASDGSYIVDLANYPSGYSSNDDISVFASYGANYANTIFQVSGTSKTVNLTLNIPITSNATYAGVGDLRAFTGSNLTDWTDVQLANIIRRVTQRIDQLTGRTWQGVQTVSNELYDGDDTDTLWLNHTDIVSVSAVSIDTDGSGTYSSLSGTNNLFTYPEGYIIINSYTANITVFRAAAYSTKVSYTWGNSFPTQEVRDLCLLMAANELQFNQQRDTQIQQLVNKLKWKGRGLA